ncbi:MAG TPA: proline dehydrogenase family protein [Anaerolineaceae bacterium]
MMRAALIQLSKASWAQRLITRWGVARTAARRFVAGETPEEAIRAVQELNRRGILATVDQLGENTVTVRDARQAAQEIERMLDLIHEAGARSNLSLKLSQIGLLVDVDVCRENLIRILEHARGCQNFVRIDMEDSALTDSTIEMFREARADGFENVGIVLQAYLKRTEADLCQLLKLDARIRLCKGAYNELASVAFPQKADVDTHYDYLAEVLLERIHDSRPDRLREAAGRNGLVPPIPAFATHDPKRIAHVQSTADRLGLPRGAYEFQMLYGIRRDLQESLAADGFPVRVYVPYGTHWYPYLMRRLAERPANVWFMLSNTFRK